ncbi:spaetzle-processing enzyme-like isoform X2 [Pomacea canaliculata]|uniref:spaetzle-processing enzyme-like isoform X2 n=1 Tax=Pomacea canaliculata TaxID=400727 RepID=UPI000D7364BC|nr:spaetzle-processing enzyme-like isoform X2 [Pomacea canaliculata]
MFNKLYLRLSAWLTVKGLSFINCGNPIVACKAILVSKSLFKAQMKLCILSANLGAGLTEVCVFPHASSDKDIMNNTAFSFTDLGDETVRARPQQGNPPTGPSTQKRSVRTFIKGLTWRHLLIACLIIALIAVVIAVSVYFGKKRNTAEAESCFPSPGVRLDYSQDANFVAYVVLFWPWSSDMNNSSSQVYDERKIQADYLVKKIFQSSSRSSCITCVAKDMVKFGGNTLLLVNLNVTCESMTEGDIQNAYEEGYSRLLTTQDKSCVSNINPKTSVNSIGEDTIAGPSPISSTICGQSQLYPAPKIVGGQQVHRGQYPWVVMLLRDGRFYCGGTIWDYDHILTAAHCVPEFLTNNFTGEVNTSGLEVIAGKWESDVDGGYPGEQRVGVAAGRIYVNYSTEDVIKDIAILKLNQSLEPTQLVMKVCHPTADATLPEQGIVAGWGNTHTPTAPDSLLSVQLTVFDHHTCAQLLSFTRNTLYHLPVGTVCAIGNQLKDKDSCNGDSGGPLFWNLGTAADERHTVIGVASHIIGPTGCEGLGLPGVYASVQFFLDWIEDTITFL